MKRNIILYVLLSLFAVCFTACKDDELFTDESVGKGESRVECTMAFRPMMPALNGKTRTAGNAINSIESLCVLRYDSDKKLVKKDVITQYTESSDPNPRATFSLAVPYGRYYIYAVANMGDLAAYDDVIKTVDGLKAISLSWNADDIAANNQMFGHFDVKSAEAKADGTKPGAASLLVINRKSMALHADIRRAASKVTVAYDGSRLAEGVFVYINSVQIKDIPSTCLLGDTNTVKDKARLIADGEKIAYPATDTPSDSWEVIIAKGRPYYPYEEGNPEKISSNAHSESAEALFFYENMQGEGKDKAQDRENMGDNSKPKDDKPCGTYIEVTGYYRSINPDKVGNGPIKFRFMLGKDIKTDYDAERNYHYKLTLVFNKFANDADWHIEYEEIPPSIIVPDEYYISYLYNRTMNLPIKINTGGGKLTSLQANIITNNWAPYNNDLDYARQYDYDVNPDNPALNAPWNGFLSLRKTKYKILDTGKGDESEGIHKITDNKSYYSDPNRNLGTRKYEVADGVHSDAEDGDYTLKYNDDETIDIQLPFYTREKQLIISTGYTGNNPYVAYHRRATVEVSAELEFSAEGGGIETKLLRDTCEIFQMRRVVNPKGIYRRHDKMTPFHVNLKVLPKENATEFMSLTSYGPWKAEVLSLGGEDFVTVDGGKEVSGFSGSQIDFTVGFKGTCGANESRCAVIRVDYNHYSCQHLIFVRQGYAPIQMISGGARWHTFNLLTKDSEVASPCDEGSLFKFGNLKQPIAASNQKNKRNPWIHVKPEDFKSDADTLFTIVGGKASKWAEISYEPYLDGAGQSYDPTWTQTIALPAGGRIARYEDYHAMFIDDAIQFNYGVLYGDDASETASLLEDVYGYRSGNPDTEKGRGMRGCFVYNSKTGSNLFFPIGASGYGRRRDIDKDWSGSFTNNAKCVHRYGSRTKFFPDPSLADKPLFYDLFMRPGAVYWLEKSHYAEGENRTCLDINYFSFDFNVIGLSNDNGYESDACFIRCVE